MSLCADLGDQIQAVIDTNSDATTEPANDAVDQIELLYKLLREENESAEDFNVRLYNEYLYSGIEREDPGFGQPVQPFPAACRLLDSTKSEELQKLISDTTDALTYRKWLTERHAEACEDASEGTASLLNEIELTLA